MNETIIRTLTAVVNTLDGITIRADQIDAIQRINACTRELRGLTETIKTLTEEGKENKEKVREGI